ncbi:chromosome segregation protein SMC [candidate division KSB1 bacterium]|nr:chromosome segregation protein SMC [candidate division KSB1 bacterium]
MKLAELNLVGFKSFAKKTNILFHDGMTVIVGPNGCGKSNIVDSIRWVMGEQKSGVLRSEKMDNVIFAGSASAKPVGMAEVSLKIENSKNILPVDYSEVLITRRLFRSGESQYLINGNQCRLKDISDMFMDTGMALGSYSVIELPQVDQLLNGKPEERRKIFEEAAGITRYKLRRKATFRKLESTEKDLIRIEDIMSEVEKSVRSLRRQVKKASKYQEHSDKLKEIEIQMAEFEYARILDEMEPLHSALNLIKDEKGSVSSDLAQKEAAFESLRHELLELETKLSEGQRDFNTKTHEIQKFEERVLVNSERVRSLKETQQRNSEERKSILIRVADLEKNLDEANYELKTAKKDLLTEQENYAVQNEQYQNFRTDYDNIREELKNAEAHILRYTEELSLKQNEGERLKATEENLSNRLHQINEERVTQDKRLQELEIQISEVEKQKNTLSDELDKKRKKLEEITKKGAEAKNSLESLQKSEMQDRNRIEVLENQAEMVKRLLESYQDYPSGVRYLATNEAENFKTDGAIANIFHMDAEYRPAIAAALGDAATHLIVEDTKTAFSGIGILHQDKKGVASFIPLKHITPLTVKQPKIDDLGVIGWANTFVQCDKKYKPVADILLGSFLIVQDLETANRLYENLKTQKVNIVTLSGEMFVYWGIIKGGSFSKKQTDFVGRQEQLDELLKEIEQVKNAVEQRRKIMVQRSELISSLNSEGEALIVSIQNLEDLISAKKLELGQQQYEEQSIRETVKERDQEKQRLMEQMGALDENLKTKNFDTKGLKEKRQGLVDHTKVLNEKLTKIEAELNESSEAVQKVQVKVAQLQSRYESRQRESDSLRNQIYEAKKMIEVRDEETKRALEESEELVEINETYQEKIKKLKEERNKVNEKLEELKEEQYNKNVKIDEFEKGIRSIRGKTEQLSETIHQNELRFSELKMNLDNLQKRLYDDYEYKIERKPVEENFNFDETRKEIDSIKEKLKSFGPVNLLALKEFEQERKRLEFLKDQREDLIKARQDLKDTINIINKTARDKFIGTFQEIQKNFSEVFKTFFEGGRASLVLREGEDPLEADIDIFATPGGKRLSSLALLSGGEKSLTAVSLLFAIYLVKPSPFCIFDEVDAPLDDVNVERFAKALQEYSQNTQFIIVTHNKLTMRAANQLYGVTMAEKGVSKVVSVKFDRAMELTNEEQPVPANE